jgi:hypothetical protein
MSWTCPYAYTGCMVRGRLTTPEQKAHLQSAAPQHALLLRQRIHTHTLALQCK